MAGHPGLRLDVEGHTDSVGGDDYNQALSEHRGESVRDFLTSQGMASGAVTTKGFGKSQPVASNDTTDGRQQNRRVELVISGEIIGTPNRREIELRNAPMIDQSEHNSAVAVYESHAQAEAALKRTPTLRLRYEASLNRCKDYHTEEQVIGYYNAGDRMKRWGKSGAFWGGMWGLLFGSAFFAIPGIGPVLVAGPLVGWIIAALEGAVVLGGASAIGAGLYSIGIPKDSIIEYEAAIKSDKFVVVVHGSEKEVERAKQIMTNLDPTACAIHGKELAAAAQ